MASIAQDRIPGQAGRGRAAKAPLSTHPAFPFIVGLWFAALLGIGSLVVPVPLIERLVEMTGLAAIVPQTAPPLGFTARALIALTCTVAGGLTGLLIARKVGQAHAAPREHTDGGRMPARRPISAHDELGEDGFDGPRPVDTPLETPVEAPRGRRALTVTEEAGPSDVFERSPLQSKPLPLSALDLSEVEALELADAEMLEDEEPEDLTDQAPEPGFTTLSDYAQEQDFSMAERQHFKLDTFGQTVGAPIQPRQQFVLDPAPAAEAEIQPQPEPEPEPQADLHFSPPSLARPFAMPEAPVDEPAADQPHHTFGTAYTEDAEMDRFAPPAGPQFAGQQPAETMPGELEPVTAAPDASAPAPVADWQDGEPDDLGLVQLAQRLGSSIARRREMRAAAAAAAAAASVSPVALQAAQPAAAPAVLAEDFDAAEAAEAAQAMAAYFGSAPAAAPAPAFAAAPLAQPAAEAAPEVLSEAEPAAVVTPPAAPSPAAAVPPAARQVFRPVAPEPAPQPASLASLAHIDLGEDDEEEEDDHIGQLAASFSLPLRRPAPVEADVAEPVAEEDEAEITLAPAPFANPFQQARPQFVRIEDEPQPQDGTIEPAVVFPGDLREDAAPAASRASAEENERALREALLGLQRMSGAA